MMNVPSAVPPAFHIRDVPVSGDAILAPMDGFSDWPFRPLCRRLGSAMSITEFIRAEFLVQAFEHMRRRMTFEEFERPVAIQIYGENPETITRAALRVQEVGPDVIDINLGCPARSVAQRGAGVGLMREPQKVARLFQSLTTALHLPVTAKIRLGWDDRQNYLEIGRLLEANGCAAIAFHARTKEQGYGGEADWDAIAELRAAVRIPVIANGDVRCPADIERLKAHTGCPAVMIGRAAVGNPWIFARRERDDVPPREVLALLHEHLARSLEFYGPEKGLYLFRKHAMQYMKLQHLTRQTRIRIIQQTEPAEFLRLLEAAWAAQAAACETRK